MKKRILVIILGLLGVNSLKNNKIIYKNNYCIHNMILPKFTEVLNKPKNVISNELKLLIDNLDNNFKKLEKKIKKKNKDKKIQESYYELTINEIEKMEYDLDFYWGTITHLDSVKNNNVLREIKEEIQPEIIKIYKYISQSKILYNGLEKALNEDLSNIQKRIIEKELHGMRLNGVNLSKIKKKKYLEISLELGNLSNKFNQNVLDSTKSYEMLIKEDKNMEEMPESALELFSSNAENRKIKSDSKKGPWLITLDVPSIQAFLTYYPESEKRKEIYKENIRKASYGKYDNTKNIYEILRLNKELSKMLGYKNYVELSLSNKMATKESINKLLNDISKKSKIKGKKDYKEILKYSKKDNLDLWDVGYYLEKMKDNEFGFKQEDLKPYLEFNKVLNGLFELSNKLFDINIIEVNKNEENIDVWDKDVRYFRVYDKKDDKEEIASFYLDPYIRNGEKKGGAWMDQCIGKSKILNHKPVAYLVLNGAPASKGKPSLMTLDEMETLFHEFGHGLQHMLTNIDEALVAGINNIEWDAVELPSQFMENWCYEKETLMSYAVHYKSGEKLPEELYHKILKRNKYQVANGINRQIYFSMLDLYVYENNIKDIYEAQKKISKKYLVKEIDEEDRFLCSFEHIFVGGYSAGYYSYKWAEIMSLDAYEAFEDYMKENKDIKELGLRFRRTILEKGGSEEPMEVFKQFRKREPSSESFMKHYGLIK